jgi:hypothetical protein
MTFWKKERHGSYFAANVMVFRAPVFLMSSMTLSHVLREL